MATASMRRAADRFRHVYFAEDDHAHEAVLGGSFLVLHRQLPERAVAARLLQTQTTDSQFERRTHY